MALDRAWGGPHGLEAHMNRILATYQQAGQREGGREAQQDLRPIPPRDGLAGPVGGSLCEQEGPWASSSSP